MQYAVDRRTKRVVHADQVRRGEQARAYECPVCKASVHYRSAMGLSPDPGFAHNAHAGRLDCDLYHPSLGGAGSPGWSGALEKDDSGEFDLCLNDGEDWSLFLRFPEISDLGNARLRTLAAGSVSVVTGSDSNSISLMELRPGVGSARVTVPPSINSYSASPAGQWPKELASERWSGTCSGLNPRGTPFVLRSGEWERLRPSAELMLGSEIRIVAEATNAPPAMYSSEPSRGRTHNKLTWRVWRVCLPDVMSNSLDRWAEAVGFNLVAPSDEVSLFGVPHGFGMNGPIFATGDTFIGKVKWTPDEAPGMLSLRTPLGSESSSTWPTDKSPMHLAFSVRDSGMTTLTANFDRRNTVGIETAPRPAPGEVRERLRSIRPLQVVIGDVTVTAWQGSAALQPLRVRAGLPSIVISPDYEALRFDLQCTGEDGTNYECDLTAQMLQDRLLARWGREAEIEISAGAFGSVHLMFLRPSRSQNNQSKSRAMRWATVVKGRPESDGSSWIRRELADRAGPSCRNSRGTSARWRPLLISEMKRSKN